MFDLPDPVGMVEAALNGKLEREVVNSLMSAAYSTYITGLWRQGCAKWLGSEGDVFKDMAVATFLTLEPLQKNNFLVLTVPQDMLADTNRFARFQTQRITK